MMMSPTQYPLVNRLGGATLTEGLYSSQNLGRKYLDEVFMAVVRMGTGSHNVEIPFLLQDFP